MEIRREPVSVSSVVLPGPPGAEGMVPTGDETRPPWALNPPELGPHYVSEQGRWSIQTNKQICISSSGPFDN